MTRSVSLAAVAVAAILACSPISAQQRKDFSTPPGGLGSYGFKVQVPPTGTTHAAVPRIGRMGADNICPPPTFTDSRGTLSLQAPGGNPATCYFKSEVKERKCDCSTYRYKDVHAVTMKNDGTTSTFTPDNYEEAQDGTKCVSFARLNVCP